MSEDCGPIEELLAGYALGALEPDEAARVERHLGDCSPCRRRLDEYEEVHLGLLAAATPVRPPARLRSRLEARLSGAAAPVVPRRREVLRWALGAALTALLVLNAALYRQVSRLQAEQRRLSLHFEADRTALALASYPGTVVALVEGEGTGGTVVYDPDLSLAVLHLWGLEPPGAGEVYQAWLVDSGGARVSAGVFSADEGIPFTTVVLRAPEPVRNYASLGVTIEPVGGSPEPTGERVVAVEF